MPVTNIRSVGVRGNVSDVRRNAWLQKVAASGLEVLNDSVPAGIPTALQALQKVVNMEVEPVAKVAVNLSNASAEVDRQWLLHAKRSALFADDDSFLIAAPIAEHPGFDWVRVRWTDGASPAQKLVQEDGTVEFLAMALDGLSVCAITEEEYDYWIVVHRFD
jgi:hypothetical protein